MKTCSFIYVGMKYEEFITMPVKKINIFYLFLSSLFLISCHRSDKMFIGLSPSKTNIHFANNLEKRERLNILYYLYYYNGGGVATGDINNDGLPDIYFTANSKGNNKLYLNKGNFEFEDITEKAGVEWYFRLVHRCNHGRCKW